jgi:hypothetical protein
MQRKAEVDSAMTTMNGPFKERSIETYQEKTGHFVSPHSPGARNLRSKGLGLWRVAPKLKNRQQKSQNFVSPHNPETSLGGCGGNTPYALPKPTKIVNGPGNSYAKRRYAAITTERIFVAAVIRA